MKEITKLFCRVGSKRSILKVLKKYFPNDYNLYVEPFVGSGDVYFRIKKQGVPAVINDIDKKLIKNGYAILKTGYSLDGIDKYEKVRSDKEQLQFQRDLVNRTQTNPLDRLAGEIYRTCGTFGSIGRTKQIVPSNISSKLKKMELYKDYMKNTKLYSTDYKKIIKKYDSKDTFFFLDPPYENSESGKLYDDSVIDYEELRDILKGVRGRFVLTLNDSPEIRKIFSPFNMIAISVPSQSRGKKGWQKVRKELIIKNY